MTVTADCVMPISGMHGAVDIVFVSRIGPRYLELLSRSDVF